MPLLPEDPALLSKASLRSALVAHNVSLPPAKSRKEVYVELYVKHVDQRLAADFSSDEDEDQTRDVAEEAPQDRETPDVTGLTDDDLKAALLKHGVKAGPIVASTRTLYERKLCKLLQPDEQGHLEEDKYSDSEEEEDEESGSEEANEETVEMSNQAEQQSSRDVFTFQKRDFVYPQCFLPSTRLHKRAPQKKTKWNLGNALKSSERSGSEIPVGISRPSSVDQHPGLGSGVPSGSFSITEMVEEMENQRSLSTVTEAQLNGSSVHSPSNGLDTPTTKTLMDQTVYFTPKMKPAKDTFQDLFPDAVPTPTGIYATCRRPIKGAAGRPVQFAYPEKPVSPMTLQRREVERRLFPIQIQFLFFLFVTFVLYLIYVFA